jgi:hypothetical protein
MPPWGGIVSVVGAALANVSPYGMMIVSPVPLEPGAILSLRLVVAGAKTDVDARVVACARLAGGGRRHGAGLEFTRIAPEMRARLVQVLAEVPASVP